MQLFKNFNKFKNFIALIDENKNEIKYKDIISQAEILQNKLKKKDLILIVAENTIGSILSYIYSILNNYIIIFVDFGVHDNEIKSIITKYKPALIAGSDKKLLNLIKKNKYNKIFNTHENFYFYKTNYKSLQIDKNLQMLLPTSGSSGGKKYVKISKQNIYENTISIIKYLKITKKDRAITNMPYCYSYMLSILNTHLQRGGTIIVSRKSIIQKEFWQIFNNFKLTSFNGVPYIYEMMDKIGLKRIFSKNLKYITQAGGKLDKKLSLKIAKLALKKKIKFFSMYGQTEASPRISYLEPKFSIKKNGSIGKAIFNTKMWIQNGNKIITKPYIRGNIFFSGKNIMMGYAKSHLDIIKSSKKKYKLNTGDIGYFDKEGFYYITGRSMRYAKIYGHRIDLDEIEAKMKSKKLDIACVGKLNTINVFYNDKKRLTKIKKKLYSIFNQNLNALNFLYIHSFPRTSSKKINYKILNNFDDKL
jgi:long-subunit acyl-CoA synthetase (AMP-forming)